MIVPTAEAAAYLAAGFYLADEPECGGARMFPPRALRQIQFVSAIVTRDVAPKPSHCGEVG